MNDIVYDIETYPNAFTLTAVHATMPFMWQFEVSPRKNQSLDMIAWLSDVKEAGWRMVGFNNLGFDYPVIHTALRMGKFDAATLYNKAMAIINSQDGQDRWAHMVYPNDRYIEQIDLFKIHHFDNRARSTSLKALEFVMRLDKIQDLPFPVGTDLNGDQIDQLLEYNLHDVTATVAFYKETKGMIEFREALTSEYDRDFMNHNDTKIGKDYFQMELEKTGVQCYNFGPDGRQPIQSKRKFIALGECILPTIEFKTPSLNRVLGWLKQQNITETKGVFKDLTADINSEFTAVFGLGGIHGSIDSEVVESDDEYVVEDWDVASYYPNLSIANGFHPEHLGKAFCAIYKRLYEQRKGFAKGTVENAMLKLALNGVYGDSNNPYSIFYDPKYTMSITLNGQLLLCVLAEKLNEINGLRLIQMNTDGLTIRYRRTDKEAVHAVCSDWEQSTQLVLEDAVYSRMFIRDVNNYIAEYEGGGLKRKGAYEYDRTWSQNHGALVVPKVAEKHLVEGANIAETVKNWPDLMDFMLRTNVPRAGRLVIDVDGQDYALQNLTRYYISRSGGYLFKLLKPTKAMTARGKTAIRRIAIDKGWSAKPMNNIDTLDGMRDDIDFDYYITMIEKLCLGLK